MVVHQLKRHKAVGYTHTRVEHLKAWMREAYPDMYTTTPNPAYWEKLVTLMQHMWEHRILLTELSCIIFALLPKINVETQGTSQLKVLWKVVKAIIDTRVKMPVKFHYILHGFHAQQGTGTAIMELNMAQEVAVIDQDPLLLVLLECIKA